MEERTMKKYSQMTKGIIFTVIGIIIAFAIVLIIATSGINDDNTELYEIKKEQPTKKHGAKKKQATKEELKSKRIRIDQYVHKWRNDMCVWTIVDHKGVYIWHRQDKIQTITDSIVKIRCKQAMSVANTIYNMPVYREQIEKKYGVSTYDVSLYKDGDAIAIGEDGTFKLADDDTPKRDIIGVVRKKENQEFELMIEL